MHSCAQGYQFENWFFIPKQDELICVTSNQKQKLEPQVSRLLTLFLTTQGEVLSQSFITESLWPDTVVEPNSLYQLLAKLRKVLKDTPRTPTFIKTVPKKGYCFICNVKTIQKSELTPQIDDHNSLKNNPKFIGKIKEQTIKIKLFLSMILIVCFGAIAYFNKQPQPHTPPRYQVDDISHELGLEFDIAAHLEQDLIAYVDQFNSLVIANKQGNSLYEHHFETRVARPSWHPKEDMLAFWQYIENTCVLHIIRGHGQVIHKSSPITCEKINTPAWQVSHEGYELIVTVADNAKNIAYLYRKKTKQFVKVPVPLKHNESLVTTLTAWENQTYYLIEEANHHSKLITLDGKVHLAWSYPVWLVAFDPKNQSIISNDSSKYNNLIGTYYDGQTYDVMQSTQGLFSTLSIDLKGNIYAAAESWQVNIRDNDALPIFSSSSIDYLPVSNLLGETAFMSKRSGVCEVFLHANNQIRRISFNQGHEYVSILHWAPDNSLFMSNRDNDIVIYDRNRVLEKFSSTLSAPLKNAGWIDNETLWGTDGKTVYTYDINGNILSESQFESDFMHYLPSQKTWLVLRQQQLFNTINLHNETPHTHLTELSLKQTNNFRNARIQGQMLFWLSQWSMKDYIWQFNMNSKKDVRLKKSGALIWHYDVKPDGNLLIAKMESIEGDIQKFSVLPQQ